LLQRHTAELDDGYDWARLNLRSVTEQSSLDDFLSTAELAGTEFEAEKLNVKFVSYDKQMASERERIIREKQEENRKLLRIPRR
jgi:large subunit GTPase 1